eukprot:CAMPEP_0194292180 /NCGR_PEP_ID=MMETSP0169-20130528/45102_1 /TAXON_ID=218684 /ORGANISM="Corethron pennatum, Strain L29A3" /LENGTH=398 /DNA_ID=CAMNT_0039040287 /DNA_START=138 /DNA_END=1331 /DNA_ORIENTATION=-
MWALSRAASRPRPSATFPLSVPRRRPRASAVPPPPPPPSTFRRVLRKFSERPIEYLSIPCVAAFVGISTNYAGVKMLFYPIDYTGTSWMRWEGSPYGVVGWQGVVPARTEAMASRLVDIVVGRLLSVTETFARLEPHRTAELLRGPVDAAVREECGAATAAALRPLLRAALPGIVRSLQRDIDDMLDLRGLVLRSFVRDKAVLVDLFQEVGRVELDFLVRSGFGLGALLGIGQAAVWVLRPVAWTLPAAGAAVGYVTNWLAIKLLFEPAEPVQVGPLTLQGLFEARQPEVSETFGRFMELRVLNSPALLAALSEGQDGGRFYEFLRKELPPPVPERVVRAAAKAVRRCAADPAGHAELHAYVTERLDIRATLSSRLALLSPTEFEDLLHPVFQEDEIT